jgi:hypothetical protein
MPKIKVNLVEMKIVGKKTDISQSYLSKIFVQKYIEQRIGQNRGHPQHVTNTKCCNKCLAFLETGFCQVTFKLRIFTLNGLLVLIIAVRTLRGAQDKKKNKELAIIWRTNFGDLQP